MAAVTVENRIVVLGGEKSNTATGTFNQVEEYNASTNQWLRLPNMPEGRHGIACAKLGNGIYVIGGGIQSGLSASAKVWVYYYKS